MKRIVRSDFRIILKSGCFKRGAFYMALAAFTAVSMVWILRTFIPFLEADMLNSLWGEGEMNFGLLRFESVSEIEEMTSNTLLKKSYSGYVVMMLAGIFSIESFGRDFSNGFFGFLTAKRVPGSKIYCAKVCSVFLAALLLFWGYGAMLCILSGVLFGSLMISFEGFINGLLFFFVQSLVLFSTVSFYSLIMCVFRSKVSAVISCFFMSAGMPVIVHFIAALVKRPAVRLAWIGNCSTEYLAGDYERVPLAMGIAVVYGIASLWLGTLIFRKKGIE